MADNEILLKVGAPAGIPATGTLALLADTDGSIKVMDSTGSKASVGGGGSLSAWETATKALMQQLAPALTEFKVIDLGIQPQGGAAPTTIDPNLEGGFIRNPNANGFHFLATSMIQHPKTGNWGFGAVFKTVAPHTGSEMLLGLGNSGLTHVCDMRIAFDIDATHYCLKTSSAGGTSSPAGTVVVDATKTHSLVLASDSVTLSMYIDGVLAVSQAVSGLVSLADEAFFPFMFNSTGGDLSVGKVMIGYVP